MVNRFLFFPLFFPKTIESLRERMFPKPLIFDESGKEIQICSSLVLHKIVGKKCVWCGRTVAELSSQVVGSNSNHPLNRSESDPQPDFNSPTTATVNAPIMSKQEIDEALSKLQTEFGNVERMDLSGVKAYCLKCKIKTEVLDPIYNQVETHRGIRNYLKGTCATCGSKINAIVGMKQ